MDDGDGGGCSDAQGLSLRGDAGGARRSITTGAAYALSVDRARFILVAVSLLSCSLRFDQLFLPSIQALLTIKHECRMEQRKGRT